MIDSRTLHTFLRDDAGTPLGPGMPSGAPLRLDTPDGACTPDGAFSTPICTGGTPTGGDRHYDAWLRLLRADPCAYCGGPGGTVDHVEPRSRPRSPVVSA